MPATSQATAVLAELGGGDASAAQRLLPLVYEELRRLAGSHFKRQRPDHTLQPTALVHEAFMRLIDQSDPESDEGAVPRAVPRAGPGAGGARWKDRAHFFAVAAMAMRQILTDHARRRKADKRGGDWEKISLDRVVASAGRDEQIDVIMLDDALTRLAEMDARKHRIVELRFFGGLSVEEVANVLGVSKTTVESDWRAARAWLNLELSKGDKQD